MRLMSWLQKLLLILLASAILGWQMLDISHYLNITYLKANLERILNFLEESSYISPIAFFLLYVLVAGLSLPGAVFLTIASGALFGFSTALILVSFGSSLGATFAFLVSKTLFKGWVKDRFPYHLAKFSEGWMRNGDLYLFSVRLVPVFPFFLVNILAGILPIHPFRFYLISQLSMFPATVIYVNAGRELGKLRDISDIMSLELLTAFLLVALLPFVLSRFCRFLNPLSK